MKPELLLPVGNMQMCFAAIHGGADAIYVGFPYFNARGRSQDLGVAELKEMVDLCHLYGVRVNLALNIVIFQPEIPPLLDLLQEVLPLGVDAIIVQDLGLARLIKSIAPDIRLHASTQMTVTNSDAIDLVEDLGIERFVLGRENSLSEVRMIREKTSKELEVFVHGALCVAYSGQCFTSESLGGRSANRGQCAQSCRLEYELYVDDEKKDLGDIKYLVSPKDLMGLGEINTLKEIGVNSFKVEGRLKSPEYVAATAKHYREVLDGGELKLEDRARELAQTYSRGFYTGWLHGVNHQQLVDGSFSSHRGVEVGRVLSAHKKKITLSSSQEITAGMGLLFVGKNQTGAKVFSASKKNGPYEVELLSKNEDIFEGDRVYINSNEALSRDLQKNWLSKERQKRIGLDFVAKGRVGEGLWVKATDPEGRSVSVASEEVLQTAHERPLSAQFIEKELASLSTTPFVLNSFKAQLPEDVFLHQKELKKIRRNLVALMSEKRTKREVQVFPPKWEQVKKGPVQPGLNILLRSKEQVEGLVKDFSLFEKDRKLIKGIILDFEFGKDFSPSVKLIKNLNLKVGIATTRILKPGEYYNLNTILRADAEFFLVRNLGALEYLRSRTTLPLLGDFSLNVANSFSLEYLVSKGLNLVNVSYDLNEAQLMSLVSATDPSKIEVTLHQYMPEFHMEHCVFAAFLSHGSSFRDCGRPCEKHEVKLKDSYGNMHFLKADQECRNTFFKATPQSASHLVEKLQASGIGAFRIEALNEAPEELNRKILIYLDVVSGRMDSKKALESLKIEERYGLNSGQLQRQDDYRARKKESSF